MRIVAGDAVQLPSTRAITPAQHHERIMLEQRGLRRRGGGERDGENCHRLIKGCARPKITIGLPGFQDARIARLVANHADVIRQPSAQMRAFHPLFHMQLTWSMTVFTANRQFVKWLVFIKPCSPRHRPWPPTVAYDAGFRHKPVESIIRKLIARRKVPGTRSRVVRKRRFKKIIPLANQVANAIFARADSIGDGMRVAEDLASIRSDFIFALIKVRSPAKDFVIAVDLLNVQGHWSGEGVPWCGIRWQRHRAAHGRLKIPPVNICVTRSASFRAYVTYPGYGVEVLGFLLPALLYPPRLCRLPFCEGCSLQDQKQRQKQVLLTDARPERTVRTMDHRKAFPPTRRFQAMSCCFTHCASRSWWHSRHAFGLSCCPKRSVLSAFGMSSIRCVRASKSRAFMMRGIWQETHRLPSDPTA